MLNLHYNHKTYISKLNILKFIASRTVVESSNNVLGNFNANSLHVFIKHCKNDMQC